MILEACVESATEAKLAIRAGAHQIELCGRLDLDGLTPSQEIIEETLELQVQPLKVMLRPRGGDFQYTDKEWSKIFRKAEELTAMGIGHIVFGATTPDRTLDVDRIDMLSSRHPDICWYVHKAIDVCADPVHEVNRLSRLAGVKGILTSGGHGSAWENRSVIAQMMHAAPPQIEIIPGGGITWANIDALHEDLSAKTYHGRRIVRYDFV